MKALDKIRQADPCEYCDGTVELRQLRVPFRFKGRTIYIDNVPVWVCKKCGARYFDAAVFKKLENIARQRQRIQKMASFPLANYAIAPI
jgi:YgiT-type zinc finger domain-containing protein